MTAWAKIPIFFLIIFLSCFSKNNLVLAHDLTDTVCTCAANDFCPASTTMQSHCHLPSGSIVPEGCHFDTGSCYCRPNGCAVSPLPTATPTRVPTAIPTPTATRVPTPTATPTPVSTCTLNANPNPCTVNPTASTCSGGQCCTSTIFWTANNSLAVYVSLDGGLETLFASSGPGTNSSPATWIRCDHTYDFQGRMGGVVKCSRRVTATCPLPTNTPALIPTPTSTLPPAPCQVTGVAASDSQYADRIYLSWAVANGGESQRIDVYQGNTYLTSKSNLDSGQWNFNHQNLTCPMTNLYHVYCWKNDNLYGRGSDTGSTLCPTPTPPPGATSTPRPSPTPTPTRLPTLIPTLIPTLPAGVPTTTPTPVLPTATLRPTAPPLAYEAWFQSQDGDIHAQGNIVDPLSAFPAKIFALDGEGGFPGVVSFRGSNARFGSGMVSSKEWLAKTGFVLRNFHFYDTFLGSPRNNSFNGGMPGNDGVYFAGSDQVIAGDWDLSGGKKIIILVDGNVRILGNIVVPYGSSLVLVAAGNINFGNDVSRAQGIFLADKKISTGMGPVAFEGEGSFVAGQEMDLGRNFGDAQNRFTPVEKFIFRPDLLINSLTDIWSFGHVWEELAP